MRYNPFNPQLPARPEFFVGREPEIIEFEKHLSQTMHSSPMNLSITGNRGMGKTSILVKFEEIAKSNNCLVLRLSNYEGNVSNIVELTDYLTMNLQREIMSKSPIEKAVEWMKTLKPSIKWTEFDLTVEQKQIMQEIFRERLQKMWAKCKDNYKAIVILIDEAEALEKIEGVLAFLREVFQRLSSEANYMVVLAGKLNFPERMSESFSPLNRFFPCQRLYPLKYEELSNYVRNRLKSVDTELEEMTLDYLFKKSEGHPYVLVAMCYLIFDSLNENEKQITLDIIKRSQEKVKAKLIEDFFAPMYHPLTPKAKDILKTIIKHASNTKFSFKDAVNWTNLERNNLSPYIQELLRKGILNKPERGQYEIFHALFLEYVKETLQKR